jgi:hypothetical protein
MSPKGSAEPETIRPRWHQLVGHPKSLMGTNKANQDGIPQDKGLSQPAYCDSGVGVFQQSGSTDVQADGSPNFMSLLSLNMNHSRPSATLSLLYTRCLVLLVTNNALLEKFQRGVKARPHKLT